MSSNLKVVSDHGAFQAELTNAASALVIVDFTASWCGPCQRIAPKFQELAAKYPKAVFLKVDIDECQDTASAHSVTSVPTFIFFRAKVKIDRMGGADADALESKIKQHYGGDDDNAVAGHMDLSAFIVSGGCECLNECDEHPLQDCLKSGDGYLLSDCDEQLIISVSFNQHIKLHSLRFKAPKENGPKTIKLFTNQPRTLDFDQACSLKPVQEFELTPKNLDGSPLGVFYVKFQNVSSIQLFIKDNQSDEEVTRIDQLSFIGSPVTTTKMNDFKRVAGKAGESHF